MTNPTPSAPSTEAVERAREIAHEFLPCVYGDDTPEGRYPAGHSAACDQWAERIAPYLDAFAAERKEAAEQRGAEREREACAKVAESTPLRSPVAKQRDKIAAAIRARSQP